MSVYKGVWPDKVVLNQADIQVTVDGQPLPALSKDVIGTNQEFGWGSFSRWIEQKLLAYSILHYELEEVIGFSAMVTQRYTLSMVDAFIDERVAKLEKQWTMTSDEIRGWIKQKHPEIWQEIENKPSVHAMARG